MKILVHAGAAADLEAAEQWYEAERVGLGDELRLEVDYALNVIRDNPTTWPKWPDSPPNSPIRRFLLSRFPYAIAFMSDADRIIVLAIAHTSRQPYWMRRAREIS